MNLFNSPSELSADFIFVHGLVDGSGKTWAKTTLITHYWTQGWLPKNPAFKDVRVLSFGYDSNLIKGENNCLNICHLGNLLIGEVIISPHPGGADTPILLIGHSMGGLVIKEPYMLARQE